LGLGLACASLVACKETGDAVDDVDDTIDEAVESGLVNDA
jgi:hypothetical protein